MNIWWLLLAIVTAVLIRLGHELIKDRRENGEWLWQTWNRLRK